MAFETFEFTKNWENPEDFPTYEPDEAQVRADLQRLHNESRDAINRLAEALNDPGAAAQLSFAPGEGLTAQTVRDAILEVYAAVQDAAQALLVDGTVTRQKLAQSLLERVYGGRVWVSLDTPGAAHCPDTDFPVGQLWLRPGFAVPNLAPDQWSCQGCTMETGGNGWVLTTDGSAAGVTASQLLEQAGQPGQRVLVRLVPTELDGHLSSVSLYLNGVEQDLSQGGGVFETALDRTGSLELTVSAVWPYAQDQAVIRLEKLTVVNAGAVDEAAPGSRPLTDWAAFLEAHAPFDCVSVPRALFVQTAPGRWSQTDYEVLPVDRGGTGLTQATEGQLLYGTGTGALAALEPPAEAGSQLVYDGAPQWRTKDQIAQSLGQLRLMSGTYTGTGAARSLELPVAPKLLHIHRNGQLDESIFLNSGSNRTTPDMYPAVLSDGAQALLVRSEGYQNASGNDVVGYWGAVVGLSGSVVTFSVLGGVQAVARADYMNCAGVTYTWTALY